MFRDFCFIVYGLDSSSSSSSSSSFSSSLFLSLSFSLSLSLSFSLSHSLSLFLSLSLSVSIPMYDRSCHRQRLESVSFSIAMASDDTSPQKRKRTVSEGNSDDEFETLCKKVVELYPNERKAEEARRAKAGRTSASSESGTEAEKAQRAGTGEASSSGQSVTGSESDHKVSLTCLTEDLYLHRQRAARHGRVDRLKEFVKLLASLPKEVQDGIASTDVGKDLFELFHVLTEVALNGFAEAVTFLRQTARVKESEMKHAARMAFLFKRTDVIEAFSRLRSDMNEDWFLADIMALTPDAWLISCGSSETCTQETRSHFALLKAALQGNQTQVVQCLDEVESTDTKLAAVVQRAKLRMSVWTKLEGQARSRPTLLRRAKMRMCTVWIATDVCLLVTSGL